VKADGANPYRLLERVLCIQTPSMNLGNSEQMNKMESRTNRAAIKVVPLTSSHWKDFVALFGPNGACAGCWCMYERLAGFEFKRKKGERNKRAIKAIVESGRVPGLLAYLDDEPVGWCSVAPREEFSRLQKAHGIPDSAGRSIWSVVCFFIRRRYRGRGIAGKLLQAAIKYAKSNGADIVEAYPVNTEVRVASNSESWPGVVSMFEKADFRKVGQRSGTRSIFQYALQSIN
jgi:GNAT superfamily N-acetyltransferase